MADRDHEFNIIWEFEASPEAEERLLAAFEMLFKGVVIELSEDQAI